MELIRKIFILLFISTCLTSLLFSKEVIRITSGEWRPYTSKKLKHNGPINRIIKESFQLVGVKVKFGFYPWKRAYLLAKNGSWDACSVWGKREERFKHFYFSDPVLIGKTVFFHLKSFPFDRKSINDLKGLKIGGTLEYNYGKEFMQAVKSGRIIIDWAPSDEINFNKLLRGRIHIFPDNLIAGYRIITKLFPLDKMVKFAYHPKPLYSNSYHLIFSKKIIKNKYFLKLFNKGVKKPGNMINI